METEAPVNVYADHKEKYDELVGDGSYSAEDAPFGHMSKHHIFLMAVSIGYENGERAETENRGPVTRPEYWSDEMWWVINAIAIDKKNDITVLRDKKEITDIAVKYANAGILELYNIATGEESHGSLDKNLERKLREKIEGLDQDLDQTP